jgi:hypothetical protein
LKTLTTPCRRSPVLDSEGRPTGEYRYGGNVANRALELLGKELGMFIDRSEHTNKNYDIRAEPEPTNEQWAARHGPLKLKGVNRCVNASPF